MEKWRLCPRESWGMQGAYAYRLIAAVVVNNLSPIGNIPKTETQARSLTQLPPEQQQAAWAEAVAFEVVDNVGPMGPILLISGIADSLTSLKTTLD